MQEETARSPGPSPGAACPSAPGRRCAPRLLRCARPSSPRKSRSPPARRPHSVWELLEHIRIAQEDILRFSQSADYVSPKWPDGYWPASAAPSSARNWKHSIRQCEDDLTEFAALVLDPDHDLHHAFPWGSGQTLLREALVLADHNSYHLGQIVLTRQLLGAWRP